MPCCPRTTTSSGAAWSSARNSTRSSRIDSTSWKRGSVRPTRPSRTLLMGRVSAGVSIGVIGPMRWFALEAASRQTAGMSPARHACDDEMDAATWCRHLVPDGSVYAFLADHRHQLFPPAAFADLTRQGGGHPSVPCEVVAGVMVLQALEGLSDREAISALRRDIAWKVACGLRLDDEGFHPTVLVYWRNRIRASPWPRRIFEAVRQVVEQTGVLAGRGRRVLDSTLLEDAVATQDTVTQLVAAVRRVRRLVPEARGVEVAAHDYDRPGKPECAWDDPQATQALVSGLVGDALRVLAAAAEVEWDDEQAEAVALLALVAG